MAGPYPTLKKERAEVRGLRHGVARREFGPLLPAVRTSGIGRCARYTATGRRRIHPSQQVAIRRVAAKRAQIRLRIYAGKVRIKLGQSSLKKLEHSVRLSEGSVVKLPCPAAYGSAPPSFWKYAGEWCRTPERVSILVSGFRFRPRPAHSSFAEILSLFVKIPTDRY